MDSSFFSIPRRAGQPASRRASPIIDVMPHVIEPAASARAKCRGCDQKIDQGELRFGERQPNAFGEGEMTLWFHVRCAAFKRPEPFLEVARASAEPAVTALIPIAESGLAHRRLPRAHRVRNLARRAYVLRGVSLRALGLHPRRVRRGLLRDDRDSRPRSTVQSGSRSRRSRRPRGRASHEATPSLT